MTLLIAGLVLFFGVHSLRIFAEDWRARQIAARGLNPYKGFHSISSALGLALIVWGYALARAEPTVLWVPPLWTRHLAATLMLPAFILLTAAYVPGNHIKARLGHPMLLGTKVWALSHLLANGNLADVLLFGSFLAWAILDFRSARRRDRAANRTYPAAGWGRDLAAVVVGSGVWAFFLLYAHLWLMGVRPY
ncbi:MAG: NnrU family protein [Betaproteobacteria bacterium]|nr:NnrU family protein [Betaproteobacteria bacterium]